VGSLLRSFRSAGRLRTGPRVLLLGRPNAGKSSFFNSVLGYSRSLVSDVAGTTRDYLEERVVRNGLVLRLVDTAGLRAADDAVEAEGVRRAWELGRDADVALYLVDSTDDGAIAAAPEEVSAFRGTFPDVDVLTVFTKQDRTAARFGEFGVSAIDEASVDAMLDIVAERCRPALDGVSALVTHRQAVELDRMKQLLDIVDISSDALLVATDLRELLHPLEQLTGAVGNEDVLDQVFGGFCIGK
jgi:tRNA modification GTPase